MTLNPAYRTSTVTALAARIRETRDLGILPIIADALQDAGCYEPWVESLRAGLPVAEAAGYLVPDGWWEYSRLGEELWDGPAMTEIRRDQIVRRRAELRNLHTVACPTCGDTEWVRLGVTARPCPTCPTRERWDRAKCPECKGPRERHNTTWYPCRTCGGSGDLLVRWANGGTMGYYADERSLSFDGPLPLVSARVEEIAEEGICQRCKGHWAKCPDCSGTGSIVRPAAWLWNLPVWYEVDVEGVEPWGIVAPHSWWDGREHSGGPRRGDVPAFLFDTLWDQGIGKKETRPGRRRILFPSPAAARQALIAAVRRWRYSPVS